MSLETKLEEFKKIGMYAVSMYFGRDIGCDDSDEPLAERPITLVGTPVGILGEGRVLWKGKLAELMAADFRSLRPVPVSNPPKREDISEDGFYLWGTPNGLKGAMRLFSGDLNAE